MTSFLCITIHFLDPSPVYHGKRDGGEPEWPPSPLRLFQALVDSAASRWREVQFQTIAKPSLKWLEHQNCHMILTPEIKVCIPFRIAVPNNDMDSPGGVWARGLEPVKPHRPMDLRTMKVVHGSRVVDRNSVPSKVLYLFPLSNDTCPHFETLREAARSVTHLGWGIDMVAGNAELLNEAATAELKGEVWQPTKDSNGTALRVPIVGTLDALISKHQAFLERINPEGFKPVPPLSAFRVVSYRRATDPSPPQFAAFSILKPDATGMKSFDPLRRTRDVAGMVRNAIADVANQQGWTKTQINEFIHGKTPNGAKPHSGPASPDRFQYLPIPTINHALGRVESIRRVLIAAPPHCNQQIAWARRAMAGAEMKNNNQVEALLTILPTSDWVLRQYLEPSTTWSTVTPVILPGYDDPDHLRRKLKDCHDAETQKRYLARLDERVESLLRKAFRQAGYSNELVEQLELEWREVGFQRGVELASRYLPPENLNHAPRTHVRVRFPSNVQGPIAIGSGRFRGFGLFARMSD